MERFCLLYNDRINTFDEISPSFIKKNNIDLFIKYLIFLFNSLGKKNFHNQEKVLFVDEIQNSNMSNNLIITKKQLDKKRISSLFIEFYRVQRKNHIRIGTVKPFLCAIVAIILFPFLLVLGLGVSDKTNRLTLSFLQNIFSFTIKGLIDQFDKVFLMTDHHFFSSIIAFENERNTYVLQHGLILDKRFYYPIRAGKFCAWGEHSKELLDNDPKVEITGTYKFNFEYRKTKKKINRVIYCISILDNDVVENKIRQICSICKQFDYVFSVKLHPGSMFDLNHWKELFKDYPIMFYKEEKIAEIDFDLAISENSTINIDFVSMNMPFIIYDDDAGYFERYKDIIPICHSENELRDMISNINEIDFSKINRIIVENELNSNKCTIFEKGKV